MDKGSPYNQASGVSYAFVSESEHGSNSGRTTPSRISPRCEFRSVYVHSCTPTTIGGSGKTSVRYLLSVPTLVTVRSDDICNPAGTPVPSPAVLYKDPDPS